MTRKHQKIMEGWSVCSDNVRPKCRGWLNVEEGGGTGEKADLLKWAYSWSTGPPRILARGSGQLETRRRPNRAWPLVAAHVFKVQAFWGHGKKEVVSRSEHSHSNLAGGCVGLAMVMIRDWDGLTDRLVLLISRLRSRLCDMCTPPVFHGSD